MTDGDAGTGDAGTGTGDETGWMEQAGFDADLQANPSLQKFKAPSDLAKSYLEVQKLVGGERLALPKDDAPPEEWGAVYTRLGKPEKAIDYGLDKLEMPEGFKVDAKIMGELQDKMHALNMPAKMAQGIAKSYAEILSRSHGEMLTEQKRLADEAVEALKKEHGAAYDVKIKQAGKAVNALLGQQDPSQPTIFDTLKLEDGRLLGDHPAVIQLLMSIGEKLGEDGSLPGKGEQRTTLTPDEAKRQLDEMIGDERKMNILMDADHPEHDALQALRTSLEKMVYNV